MTGGPPIVHTGPVDPDPVAAAPRRRPAGPRGRCPEAPAARLAALRRRPPGLRPRPDPAGGHAHRRPARRRGGLRPDDRPAVRGQRRLPPGCRVGAGQRLPAQARPRQHLPVHRRLVHARSPPRCPSAALRWTILGARVGDRPRRADRPGRLDGGAALAGDRLLPRAGLGRDLLPPRLLPRPRGRPPSRCWPSVACCTRSAAWSTPARSPTRTRSGSASTSSSTRSRSRPTWCSTSPWRWSSRPDGRRRAVAGRRLTQGPRTGRGLAWPPPRPPRPGGPSMVEVKPAWTFVRERRYLALRTGVATAVASIGPSFARGLLPRSTTDQAMVTGATAAYALGFSALGLSIAEAVSEIIVTNRREGNPENIALAASAIVAAAGDRRDRRRPGRQQRLPAPGDRPVGGARHDGRGRRRCARGGLGPGPRPCRRPAGAARQPGDRRGAGRGDRRGDGRPAQPACAPAR